MQSDPRNLRLLPHQFSGNFQTPKAGKEHCHRRAADTNFAFSGLPETNLEDGIVTAGNFVGIERPTADIGGFKIIGLGQNGFTIDDFTFLLGAPSAMVAEPGTLALLGAGAVALALARRIQR